LKVLLLSAYAAGSHVSWRRGLQTMLPDWEWRVLELPPRHFSWRVRGNPLYWALEYRTEFEQDFDLLLATSMVDLATLRGLVPDLARLPTALYFHENQFDYPAGRGRHGHLEAQMVSLYAALAADRLLFNSRYNLDGFLRGCAELLGRLPDKVPAGVPESLAIKSVVLPVAVDVEGMAAAEPAWPGCRGDHTLRLLWSGRFEYDKGADRLLAILGRLEARGLDYELAVVGQRFREEPPECSRIADEFSQRIVHFGYVPDRSDYGALLRGADLVLSTALHEFQGLAVMEAVAAGCIPVVPDRLAYTELYPPGCRYQSCLEDPETEADSAVECLLRNWSELRRGPARAPDMARFAPASLAPQYRLILESLTDPAG
jgi:glycosyltransferase involved in cell wall biosynthesis